MSLHVEDHGVFVESFIGTFSAEEIEKTSVNRIRVSLDKTFSIVAVIAITTFVFSSLGRIFSTTFFRLVNIGLLSLLFIITSRMIFFSFTFYTSNSQNTTWFFTVAKLVRFYMMLEVRLLITETTRVSMDLFMNG